MIVVMTESVTLARLASYLATVNRYRASRPELAASGGRAPRRPVERAGQLLAGRTELVRAWTWPSLATVAGAHAALPLAPAVAALPVKPRSGRGLRPDAIG